MTDKGADLDIIKVGLIDEGGDAEASAVPRHLELWMFLVNVLRQHVDAHRVAVAAHEGYAGDVASVLVDEIIQRIGVQGQSRVFP